MSKNQAADADSVKLNRTAVGLTLPDSHIVGMNFPS